MGHQQSRMGSKQSRVAGGETYRITVKTNGSHLTAATSGTVKINMLGETSGSSTGWIELHKWWQREFDKGLVNEFEVKASDVGMPILIRIELKNRLRKDEWKCDDIVIRYKNEEKRFPVFDWIEEHMTVLGGDALPSYKIQNCELRNTRISETEISKVRFKWVDKPTSKEEGWGMPRYSADSMKTLQDVFIYNDKRLENIAKNGIKAVLAEALEKLKGRPGGLVNFESYATLYKVLNRNSTAEIPTGWKTDEEFGWQQMNGISPLSYSRCRKLPDSCNISNDDVAQFFEDGRSLEEEMERGTIYIADYSSVFQGVKRNTNSNGEPLYCPDAICLYHVNKERNLVPIAIQLVPDDPDSVFTPKDREEDWLLAKMYFKVAVGNLHEWYYHFFLTHNVAEPFCISVFRCFPRSHPMYKLMRPHLQTVALINTLARGSLIQNGSVASHALAINALDCAKKSFKTFHVDDMVIPEVLKKQGLDDKTLLPNNFYRDDVLDLWDIIHTYVTDVLTQYYSSDEDIELDDDIQAFARDLAYQGFGWEDDNKRGIPVPMKKMSELIRLCTSVIFCCSVQHAAVNFGQYDTYKFIPQAPVAMRLPPHKKGEATMTRIMDSLPDINMAATSIIITYTLSQYSDAEIYLGHFPRKFFNESKIEEIQEKFREKLKTFAEKVEERNSKASHPYDQLLPSKIPTCIAI